MMHENVNLENNNQCFVIMPISDPNEYQKGHFREVYEDIFIPAINEAGFKAKRADDDKSSNIIQVGIIRDIIESPMAICDLSSRNPNVLFELGIRQSFDLPVVLVQEEGTPRIFDISTINTIDYRKDLLYREVIEDRRKISKAISETKDNKNGINSIVRLLGIDPAKKRDGIDTSVLLFSLSNQIQKISNKLDELEGHQSDEQFVNNLFYQIGHKSKTNKEEYYLKKIKEIEARYQSITTMDDCETLIHEIELMIETIDLQKTYTTEEKQRIKKLLNAIKCDIEQRIYVFP